MNLSKKISENDQVRGNIFAPLILVEYGDFECPRCVAAYKVVKKLQQYFGDRLLFVFRNFPLSVIHPNAIPAAYVAEASGLQGKFWPVHDFIFENCHEIYPLKLLEYTLITGADAGTIIKDANSHRVFNKVEADIDSGEKSGVHTTPTFFINGRKYTGSYNYEELLEVLDFHY
jgi:protein-disulfide isomerase